MQSFLHVTCSLYMYCAHQYRSQNDHCVRLSLGVRLRRPALGSSASNSSVCLPKYSTDVIVCAHLGNFFCAVPGYLCSRRLETVCPLVGPGRILGRKRHLYHQIQRLLVCGPQEEQNTGSFRYVKMYVIKSEQN